MILGVRGDLISGACLSRWCGEPEASGPEFEAWVRALIRWWRRTARALGPASGQRAILDIAARPLLAHLGFSIRHLEPHRWGHAGVIADRSHPRSALLCLPWGRPLDAAWREATRLGLTTALPWAFVYNGAELAIVDCSRPWSRRSMAVGLETACADPEAAAVLWMLARAGALDDRHGPCRLAQMIAASDRHGVEVCGRLGAGVLEALGALVAGLDEGEKGRRRAAGRHRDTAILDQALTIVYRLLFLFFAEARGLVPAWHDVYREAYGLEALCDRLLRQLSTRGTWASLQAMARLAHAGCRTSDLEVTAFNGRLFAPARTPLAERRHLPESAARRAVLALGTTSTPQGPARIRFHDLGVEQLGSVYERVLEMEPVRQEHTLTLRPTSTDRKTSGSFYTPRSVTDFVVRRTLGPLVEGRSSHEILQLRIVDPAMGSGAFLVAACRYLAARAEEALIAEGVWPEFDIPDGDRAELRRTVAERCVYGVDLNPTAVQLTRLSLWLTTLAASRPLTFLDHHLAAGNSLVGARLIDLARPPGARPGIPIDDRQRSLFDDNDADGLRRVLLPERLRLALEPSDTARAVRDKERRLDHLHAEGGPLARWRRAADLWCGLQLDPQAGLAPATYAELLRHAAGLDTSARQHHLSGLVDRAVAAARAEGAFHWELMFPEVFVDQDGRPASTAGFDAVIGNPPWEMLRGDTGGADARRHARDRSQSLVRFTRRSGHYVLQGAGHANQYQLFLERSLRLVRRGGRLGLILPSGIESDVGSVDLRRALLDSCRVDTWLGFDNRHAIFPVHRGLRFVIVSAARDGATEHLPVTGGLTEVSDLSRLPDNPHSPHTALSPCALGRPLIERFDPVHLTVPRVAGATDLSILTRAMEAPMLGSAEGWAVRFGRELNATDDKRFFTGLGSKRAGRAGARDWLPIVEGKHLRPFGVGLERVTTGIEPGVAARLIDQAASFGRARVCYRDVASATNRVTLIAAILPAGTISTHTVFCARTRLDAEDRWCLTALLNSLTANFLVRLQMSTHVTSALMARLPVPRPARRSPTHRELAALAEELSATSIDDNPGAYARVNTITAALYGLSGAEYRHVIDSFPLLGERLRSRCLDDHAGNHRGGELQGPKA